MSYKCSPFFYLFIWGSGFSLFWFFVCIASAYLSKNSNIFQSHKHQSIHWIVCIHSPRVSFQSSLTKPDIMRWSMAHGQWPMNDKYLIKLKQKQGHTRRTDVRELMMLIRVFIDLLFFFFLIFLPFAGLMDSKKRLSFVNSEFNNIQQWRAI